MMTHILFLTLWLHLAGVPHLTWQTPTTFDFGEVEHRQLDTTFIFRNDGPDTLQIEIVRPKSACDCTWAEWTETPIPPGRTANIVVHHNPRGGTFRERFSVWFFKQRQPVKLYIEGFVTN